jgi:hypothetical protein
VDTGNRVVDETSNRVIAAMDRQAKGSLNVPAVEECPDFIRQSLKVIRDIQNATSAARDKIKAAKDALPPKAKRQKTGEAAKDALPPKAKRQKTGEAAAVQFAMDASSGVATSSMPPADAMEQQQQALEDAEATQPKAKAETVLVQQLQQQNSFKRLRNELKVKKMRALIVDGGHSPFLEWAASKWPALYEQACKEATD